MTEPLSGSAPVEIDRITIRYGAITAVESVTISIAKGDVYALLGRNGSGKSSIVRCMLGMQKPAAGGARLFGLDAWESREVAMRRIGIVPEEPDAPPGLSANQIINFCRRFYPTWNDEAVSERLYQFSIDRDKPFGRLSKGQKSQVMLAIALGPEPDVLVLDDPTLGLDVVARNELFEEIIVDLADRGTTVFITTHDLAGIEPIANRVGILHESRIIVDETLDSLKSRFRRLRVDRASSAFDSLVEPFGPLSIQHFGNGAEAIVANFGDETVADGRGTILPMSLQEIFVALTSSGKETNP